MVLVTAPREIPYRDVESAPTLKQQADVKEPFYRGADYRDDQGTEGRRADSISASQARTKQSDLLKLKAKYGGMEVSEAATLKSL